MNRRTFILTGMASASVVVLPFGCDQLSSANVSQAASWPSTVSMIWDEAQILTIGAKYRETFSQENSRRKLSHLLKPLEGADIESIIREDFVAGRTVTVHGWILSLTEARQCAFASLNQTA